MADKVKRRRLYRSRSPLKVLLIVFLCLVLFILIFVISVFFAFQKYVVYTDEGAELQVPWIEELLSEEDASGSTTVN